MLPTQAASQRIGLDSNCLSYLISVAAKNFSDGTSIDEEGIALLRIWFYTSGRFFITETVANECRDIRDAQKLKIHSAFTAPTYWGIPVRHKERVDQRASQFKALHSGAADCLTLAEAEDVELDLLLTHDKNFLRLGRTSGTNVKLSRPSAHWASLAIPKGSPPINRPTQGNPLEGQSWWLWQ